MCAASDSTTSTWTTANCTPPNSMSCALRPRHASTNARAGQSRHVQHAAPSRHPFQGPGDCGLAIWVTIRTSGRISRMRRAVSSVCISLDLGTDHGQGAREAGLQKSVAHVRGAAEVRDTPILQQAGKPAVGGVVDDQDRSPTEVELLHNAQSHSLEPHTIT